MSSRGRVEGTREVSSAKEKMLSTRNAVLKAAPRLGGPEQMYLPCYDGPTAWTPMEKQN